jgi:hypothetical protein
MREEKYWAKGTSFKRAGYLGFPVNAFDGNREHLMKLMTRPDLMRLRRLWNPMLFAFICMAGCDGRPTRVPVSGTVLIDGEPLKYGAVIFVPEGGRASTGGLDQEGHFTLTCFSDNDGALIGKHAIQVIANEQISNTKTRVHAPKKYNDTETSGLAEEVTGPTNSIEIHLTWKGNVPDKPYMESDALAGDMPSLRAKQSKKTDEEQ